MTENEFSLLIERDLAAAFPETTGWLKTLPNHAEVLRLWFGELADLSYSVASDAILAIHRGEQPAPKTFERESWPGFIRRAAWKMGEPERREKERRELVSSAGAWAHVTERDGVMAKAFRAACDARKRARESGGSEYDISEAGQDAVSEVFG